MENASEYEAPRMSIQTKDLIRYNNHITYYKKNHSDFIQKSHYNSTNRQQNPSIYFVRQPEIFSLFKEMRGGEAFIVAKAIFPPRAPPLRPRSFVVRCGDVCMYWWGDGCCGIGYKTLCRFIPILHNFLQSITYSPQTTRKLSLSSTPSSAALTAHPTPGKPLSLTL